MRVHERVYQIYLHPFFFRHWLFTCFLLLLLLYRVECRNLFYFLPLNRRQADPLIDSFTLTLFIVNGFTTKNSFSPLKVSHFSFYWFDGEEDKTPRCFPYFFGILQLLYDKTYTTTDVIGHTLTRHCALAADVSSFYLTIIINFFQSIKKISRVSGTFWQTCVSVLCYVYNKNGNPWHKSIHSYGSYLHTHSNIQFIGARRFLSVFAFWYVFSRGLKRQWGTMCVMLFFNCL